MFVFFIAAGIATTALVWADLGETNATRGARFSDQFRAYPDLLREGLFWAWCGSLVFSVGGFYAFLGGAPKVGEDLFGLTPAWLGLGMGSISGGFMLGNYLGGRMTPRYGLAQVMLAGRVMAMCGPLLGLALFSGGWATPYTLFGPVLLVGFGNGLTLPGANAGVMSVAPRLAGSASGLSGALTVGGGAVITSTAGWAVGFAMPAQALFVVMLITSALAYLYTLVATRIEASRGLPA